MLDSSDDIVNLEQNNIYEPEPQNVIILDPGVLFEPYWRDSVRVAGSR